MAPIDATLQARLLTDNSSWDAQSSIVIVCSFPSGSCALNAFRLTPSGTLPI